MVTGKLQVGSYRVQCRYVAAFAKSLVRQWLNGEGEAVRETIHHIHPRRKSVHLALLVYRDLMAAEPLAAAAFIEFMNPNKRKEKGYADKD